MTDTSSSPDDTDNLQTLQEILEHGNDWFHIDEPFETEMNAAENAFGLCQRSTGCGDLGGFREFVQKVSKIPVEVLVAVEPIEREACPDRRSRIKPRTAPSVDIWKRKDPLEAARPWRRS